MIRVRLQLPLIASVSFLLCSGGALCQHASDGWQNLFNGKDLSGWKQLNGQAKYEVRNGEIVGSTVNHQPNSFLATEKDYGDFILDLELLVDTSMN
jgi:hypothetical protein